MLQIIRILSLIGVWLSGLSLYEYLSIQSGLTGLSLCKIGQTFDCATVSQSTWSVFLGLPLASWGIVFYVSTFLFAALATRKNLVSKETSSSIFLLIFLFASLFSVFLFSVSYFLINKLCPLCMGLYLVNFLLLATAIKYAKPITFFQGVLNGAGLVLKAPFFVIGMAPKQKLSFYDCNLVRVGGLLLLLILFATTALEDYIKSKIIIPVVESNQLITEWKNQPLEHIELVRSGSFLGDYTLGKEGAPIEIIEFSDFQCSACRRLYAILKPLLEQYKDKIHFIFKNFPLDSACNPIIEGKFHEHACYAANLARCAGEQDKFWQLADYINNLEIFDTSDDYQSIRAELDKGISVVGLDPQAVRECISSERELNRIKQDVTEGNRLVIRGTPTIWINRRRFSAGNPSDFKDIFDYILANNK